MAKFILGRKIGMSRIFLDNGESIGVTVIEVGPCVVTQVRNIEKDGYIAAQIGFEEKKKLNKPQSGHLKELGLFGALKEFRVRNAEILDLKVGDKIDASIFQIGEKVAVSGINKGRGFQGVVKRHQFRGGSRTHGQKHSEREAGSIGSVWPQRVVKGKRMAGRMGGERVTWRGIKIMKVDAENNIIALKGAVPGRKGTLLEIRASI
ncbi:MAG: 50S ribosomal protein L3 [Parcubacteria group bacterium GW2011_GWD2_38_12]|nr:MAG: 50S ribosomal protein L3 [Parcubacteria group bacterium GW2011_GWC2_36_17]KKQ40114.1 MAG: 50S ribosomal protein L3 [Candidatus Moranbacteria bacterium GW2011_GWF2_37_7]KKQ52192.1 MAG: 50S ribosomal protein L3 [Parcubacteria group bacterium GW2011_GWD2_38_12]KKQ58918.1 MAG: 50S ribosomal protein L3 [Parcubacteria group bacterium GW2011_GWC1_38_17]